MRSNEGEVEWAACKQQRGKFAAELEEAKALLFGLQKALERGYQRIVMESDCQGLVQMLKTRKVPKSCLEFFVSQILVLARSFISCCWSFIRREGNRVAHSLAKFHLVEDGLRVWEGDLPELIVDLAIMDLCYDPE